MVQTLETDLTGDYALIISDPNQHLLQLRCPSRSSIRCAWVLTARVWACWAAVALVRMLAFTPLTGRVS